MIGIWGPSGIGKNTIARVLFSKHSHRFQLSVFMENIKRRYHGHDEYSAKLQLKKEFLSQIINQEDIKIHHLGVAKDRLKGKRVLVVLDDVDQSAQLDAMAEEAGWFGPGSWIIITTQDEKLLKAHGINHIYKVDFPSCYKALKIFCMYAFGQKSPYEGFENLAWEVTQLVGNLPLGLRVMGSYLKGMLKQEWEEELPRLRTSLDGKIESILEFSYNALRAEDKELFLYIACFFNNEQIKKVKEHLAKNFSNVRRGLQVLAEKSLISDIRWGNIEMHDLLERLGREIVRKQSIHDPGQRQFLVDARDICEVLNNDTVSGGSVIGAIINFSEIEDELNRSDSAFERMSSLQFLRLHDCPYGNSYLPQSLNNLPRKLRLLDWLYFPMTCLPSNFNLEFLVELKMRESKLEKLWEGIKAIRNLKWIDLSYSKKLEELPNLSTATNLHELKLSGCSRLVELPSSIWNATNLQKLDLSGCSSLVELPSSIANAVKLQRLNLGGCSSLVELPSSVGNAIKLQRLNLSGCLSLVELPSSIGNITSLRMLNLSGCSSLMELPSSIGNLHKLWSLRLKGCSKLEAIPININMESLYELDLTDCLSLKKFPEISTNIEFPGLIETAIEEIPSWSRLQKLVIKGCTKLVSLPQLPDSLEILDAENCESLDTLHCSFHNTRFVYLNFANCFKLSQEARELIIKTSSCENALLSGEKVPTYFTYRATGSSLSMKLNGFDTHFPTSLRFQVCLLLVNKGDFEVRDWTNVQVTYRIHVEEKQNGINVKRGTRIYQSQLLKEHLYTFLVEEQVSSSELVFEFEVNDEKLEIEECGIRTLTL